MINNHIKESQSRDNKLLDWNLLKNRILTQSQQAICNSPMKDMLAIVFSVLTAASQIRRHVDGLRMSFAFDWMFCGHTAYRTSKRNPLQALWMPCVSWCNTVWKHGTYGKQQKTIFSSLEEPHNTHGDKYHSQACHQQPLFQDVNTLSGWQVLWPS